MYSSKIQSNREQKNGCVTRLEKNEIVARDGTKWEGALNGMKNPHGMRKVGKNT